jgi:flagellar basal-body rod protein FlgG
MAFNALYIAATGMSAQEVNVDNISNNIANINTTSYKRGRVNFEDLLYQKLVTPGVNSSDAGSQIPSGITVGMGTRVGSLYKIFEQGALNPTPSTPLNVAIDGAGFMRVKLPSGDIAYTRDGSWQQNSDGDMVNSLGYSMDPPINIPINATAITITSDGKVSVTVNAQVQEQGKIQLTRFSNNAGLEPIGGNMYIKTDASGEPVDGVAAEEGFGIFRQNFLENSNVNSVLELTDLIKAQRGYEFNSKVLQSAEQMYKTAIDSKA